MLNLLKSNQESDNDSIEDMFVYKGPKKALEMLSKS